MASAKILNLIGSILTMGFGIWHFFVPTIWKWYSYMSTDAKELVVAVRATNVFFSLSLFLFGALNIIFAYSSKSNEFVFKIMLVISCILWIVRIIMQLVFPQGSLNPALQYGMLFAFLLIFLCFAIALTLIFLKKI